MTRRLFGRSRETDPPAAANEAPATASGTRVEPHPINVILFTAEGGGDVQLLAGRGRITELLNAPEPIRVRGVPEAGAGDPEWIEVDDTERDEMLALVPPPQDTNPLLRLHRPGQEVSVRIGPYLISGEAHVPAGSEATGFLMRHRPHFVPLTEARIQQQDGIDMTVPVVIVNLRAADALSSASPDVAPVTSEAAIPGFGVPPSPTGAEADGPPAPEASVLEP